MLANITQYTAEALLQLINCHLLSIGRGQAELAVNRANLLTRIWKIENSLLQNNENFFFSQVCCELGYRIEFFVRVFVISIQLIKAS